MPVSSALSTPLTFPCGKTMKNRFMLAPMTNKQSQEDGTLSDDEYRWLTMRAKGQFGLVMTCASNVQLNGKCWPGQLGIYHDKHLVRLGGFSDQPLLAYFADLDRRSVRLTAAGKIHGAREAYQTLEAGMDFVTIGKSAILHHDFPAQVLRNPDFRPLSTPVSKAHLEREGLGRAFIDYMAMWKGFVES